jgi:hypothetical protein
MKFEIDEVVYLKKYETYAIIFSACNFFYFCRNREPKVILEKWQKIFGKDVEKDVIYGVMLYKKHRACTLKDVMDEFPQYSKAQCEAVLERTFPLTNEFSLPERALSKQDELTRKEFLERLMEYDNNSTKS